MRIYFPKLTKLQPTVVSSVIKLQEEIGELSREIAKNPRPLGSVLSELLDVGQVCATMMFLVEDEDATAAIKAHVAKLHSKGYVKEIPLACGMGTNGGDKVLFLPRLDIRPTLEQTFFKLTEEAGELAQRVGKKQGMSGEEHKDADFEILSDLLDVAQTCVTMLYVLADENFIDVERLLAAHKAKLVEHGYC